MTAPALATAATGHCHACNKKLYGNMLLCSKCYSKALNRLNLLRSYKEYMREYFVQERQYERISRGYFGQG